MKKVLLTTILALSTTYAALVEAADYKIDVKGAHASINFKIKHLGYSWLTGRFNDFDGEFSYDPAAPEKSKISVEINTESLDSNHAERDKHLRSDDFLDVKKFPTAQFKSTNFKVNNADEAVITGNLTLHGVTKSISFPVQKIGEGNDPWGGYRSGFTGVTNLKLADYGITRSLGPASTHVELELNIEGIKQ
ncbi:MAG: polyisoprenoid-binding protein YceI [Oleiphilaceae bacterium]|jgi:polyisoprenoid-binding protein YceI